MQPLRRFQWIYVTTVYVGLLAAWENFSSSFDRPVVTADDTDVLIDATNSEDLPSTITRLHSAHSKRLLILGSSQIHTVQDDLDRHDQSFPVMLQSALSARGAECEIVDLSAGGQRALESMIVLQHSFALVRPDFVIMGVGLFNMESAIVRSSIGDLCDKRELAAWVNRNTPPDLREQMHRALQRAIGSVAEPPAIPRPISWQQACDESLVRVANRHSSVIRNANGMFNSLLYFPVEKDSRRLARRWLAGYCEARTVLLNEAYEPSLAALATMANFCARQNVSLAFVVMPYNSDCRPPAYLPGESNRLRADVAELAGQVGAVTVNLEHVLKSDHFGSFGDGSPDALHFTASGHRLIGTRVAIELLEHLGTLRVARAEPETTR